MDCTTGIRRHLQEEGELNQEDYKVLKEQFQTRETTQEMWEDHQELLRTQDWGEVPLYDINTSADWGRQAEQVLTASDGSTDPETGETGWATILCEEGTHTVLDQELEALAICTSNNSSEAQGILTALKKTHFGAQHTHLTDSLSNLQKIAKWEYLSQRAQLLSKDRARQRTIHSLIQLKQKHGGH